MKWGLRWGKCLQCDKVKIIRFEKVGRYLKYYVKDDAAVDCMMNDELEGG